MATRRCHGRKTFRSPSWGSHGGPAAASRGKPSAATTARRHLRRHPSVCKAAEIPRMLYKLGTTETQKTRAAAYRCITVHRSFQFWLVFRGGGRKAKGGRTWESVAHKRRPTYLVRQPLQVLAHEGLHDLQRKEGLLPSCPPRPSSSSSCGAPFSRTPPLELVILAFFLRCRCRRCCSLPARLSWR